MIDIKKELNPAQYEAVTTIHGPLLVIAGAGSGKTRTIVYRLAHLIQLGINPQSILLLTFTKKAASEMLLRAGRLLGREVDGISGGTFHSFANMTLRRFASYLGYKREFSIIDQSDSQDIIKQLKESMGIGKGDRCFPKKNTIFSLISRSRNNEMSLEEILVEEASHLLVYGEEMQKLAQAYTEFKEKHQLMDYDDLLFNLEKLLLTNPQVLEYLQMKYKYIMVDEYQDTNRVQGRLVEIIGGEQGNVMAVGDDAQSIYSFRGATIRNILDFKRVFPSARIVKLEQNYRSTQSILDFSNEILCQAREKYEKKLIATREKGPLPELIYTISDKSQAKVVLNKIHELSSRYGLGEMAILFRAGYQSYQLEMLLNRDSIPYKKFGGMKFSEAAHIKDLLAYLRLIYNPTDFIAWQRTLSMLPGIGPKTVRKLYDSYLSDKKYFLKILKNRKDLQDLFDLMRLSREGPLSPSLILEKVVEYYLPFFKEKYHDDYPKRMSGIDELLQISSSYGELESFLSDITLEPPEEHLQQDPLAQYLTLSTIHSAKGLEWRVVIIIDMVEDRFPSRHAQNDSHALEEERRLFYVACTRAKDVLILCSPRSLFTKTGESYPTRPSSFLEELSPTVYKELKEDYTGRITSSPSWQIDGNNPLREEKKKPPSPVGKYCHHKIFGRGKIIGFIPPNKFRINFTGFGIKVILQDYLSLE